MSEAAERGDIYEDLAKRSSRTAETQFYERFLSAQEKGELKPGADLRALAWFFVSVMRSLAITHRLTGDRQTIADVASVALGVLDQN